MANPLRTPHHDISPPKLTDPSTAASRSYAEKYLRPFPAPSEYSNNTLPRTPDLSWLYDRHVLLGLNDGAIPQSVDLCTPRVGRAFRFDAHLVKRSGPKSSLSEVSIPIAMFGACPSINAIPPYPGVPPKFSTTPNCDVSCHVDGTYGAFDARRYPQLYDSRRPWLPFYDNPASLAFDPTCCEVASPNDFFYWNEPGQPSHDGSWVHRWLHSLFSRREHVEARFAHLVSIAAKLNGLRSFNGPSQHHATYDLPWYDPLSYKQAKKWRYWLDGREPLSYTLQYVAAMNTLNRWLQAQIDTQKWGWSDWDKEMPDQSLMGAWASTITRQEDWLFLMRFRVPVYVVTRIPSDHPSSRQLQPGNLDADEHYRMNAFDSHHRLGPSWTTRYRHLHSFVPGLRLACRAEYMPCELLNIPPPTLPANTVATSPLLGWKSAIYQHNVPRFDASVYTQQIKAAPARRSVDELFPVALSKLQAEIDRHPLLNAIGSKFARNGNQTSQFVELYDSDADGYYPRRLGRGTPYAKATIGTSSYCWKYPAERIEIYLDYQFPGRSYLFGRVVHDFEDDVPDSDADDDDDVLDKEKISPRKYFRDKPTRNQIPLFTWQLSDSHRRNEGSPSRNSINSPSSVPHTPTNLTPVPLSTEQFIVTVDPPWIVFIGWLRESYEAQERQMPQPSFVSGLFTDYVDQLAKFQNCIEEKPFWALVKMQAERTVNATITVDSVKTIRANRSLLQERLQRRFFRPVLGDHTVAPRPVPWRVTDGSSRDICYPIRLSGVHGDVQTTTVLAMLESTLGIPQHFIVILSSSQEVDTTRSFELGLRYCEDALLISLLLHGVEVDERLLEVQFLYAMSKKVDVIMLPEDATLRSPRERLKQIWALLHQPGIDPNLTGYTYQLWSDVLKSFTSSSVMTPDEVREIQGCGSPVRGVLTSIPSLLEPSHYGLFDQPLSSTQQISLGPADPAPITSLRLLCHTAMTHQLHFPTSIVSAGRPKGARTRKAHKNDVKHRALPNVESAASRMSSEMRSNLRKAIVQRAEYLQRCWRPMSLELPEFKFRIPSEMKEVDAMIHFYSALWDWQDECRGVLCKFREACTDHYDYSSFELAFGPLTRLDSLRGPYHTACADALNARASK
ncbi:hypothetical protein FRC17_009081 [Serendipita sp. 399]|nr:hypothetical protein FRC17_009081 [Serendipita sp. 399]